MVTEVSANPKSASPPPISYGLSGGVEEIFEEGTLIIRLKRVQLRPSGRTLSDVSLASPGYERAGWLGVRRSTLSTATGRSRKRRSASPEVRLPCRNPLNIILGVRNPLVNFEVTSHKVIALRLYVNLAGGKVPLMWFVLGRVHRRKVQRQPPRRRKGSLRGVWRNRNG